MQPKSIKMFQVFAWISIGLTTFFVLIAGVLGGIAASAFGFGGVFVLGMLVAIAAIVGLGVLVHLAAKKRSNVARWLYVALGALAVLFGLLVLAGGDTNAGGVVMMLVLCGVQVAAIVFLLMPDSNAYFAGQHGAYGGGYGSNYGGGYPPQQGGWGGGQPQHGGGYPPQQGGYPPQVGGHQQPHQGGGYPPQQGGYPPQQGGYPPQQGGGYPPQQGGYPPPPPGSGGY